jgi:RNA polymerase sigma-70 factor (ECF subfamily)
MCGQQKPNPAEIDELTLARAKRGERAALAAVVERYGRQVYALVGRMMAGRGDQVDDVSQEALVKVVRGLHRFETAGPARLSTWILTVAVRTCIDAQRRTRLQEPLPEEMATTSATPESMAAQRQLARRVEAVVAGLPADQRAVLVLRAYHDFDYDEIASALGIEEGTVKSRLGRARSALRRALGLEDQSVVRA